MVLVYYILRLNLLHKSVPRDLAGECNNINKINQSIRPAGKKICLEIGWTLSPPAIATCNREFVVRKRKKERA